MLSKLFRKKAPHPPEPVQIPQAEISFLGAPFGDGLSILVDELRNILDAEGNTKVAYLVRVQYASEELIRLGLVISGNEKADLMADVIGRACQALVKVDIFFLDSLSPDLQNQIKQVSPFYGSAVGA